MFGPVSDETVAAAPAALPAGSDPAVDPDPHRDNAWLACSDLLTRAQHLTTCAFMACASLDDLDQATALETILCSIEDLLADVQNGLTAARERSGPPAPPDTTPPLPAGQGPAAAPFARPRARTAPLPAPVG